MQRSYGTTSDRALSLLAAAAALAALLLVLSRDLKSPGRLLAATAARERKLAGDLDKLFAEVADDVKRCVVFIGSTKVARGVAFPAQPFGFPKGKEGESMGSGFLIDPRGYILTNSHLVADSAEISVKLHDNREFEARLVQVDAASDIALIKVDGAEDLAALPMGDSDGMRVGEWVLAVGSPFGLTQSVSAGIISALRRTDLHVLPFESFIQTDASINPGNSGGPLVNLRGEAIGINTAIYSSPSGGNQGIGFAIPISLAKALVERWIEGKSTSYMGLVAGRVDNDMARYFGFETPRGAFVTSVEPGGPAAEVGLKATDLILRFGGGEVKDENDLRLRIAQAPPGEKVEVVVLRQRREEKIEVTPVEREWPRGKEQAAGMGSEGAARTRLLGLTVTPLTRQFAEELDLPLGTCGMLVMEVQPGSPAVHKGLRPGDVILEVNEQPVPASEDLKRALLLTSDVVMLHVYRHGVELGYLFLPR
jgi:serine protease Do